MKTVVNSWNEWDPLNMLLLEKPTIVIYARGTRVGRESARG